MPPPTASPPSTTRSPTASTCSTTRSSGTRTNFLDPVEVAFLFAADAGVAVAVSAGNDGPGASTVAHPSPWLTTTGASTHNRDGLGTLKVGATTYNGKSFAPASATGTIVDAGPDGTNAGLCFLGALDPAAVAGKIVVCDRGVNARTEKSLAVQFAGGIGMILVNTSPNSVNADLHFVPTIHLQNTDRASGDEQGRSGRRRSPRACWCSTPQRPSRRRSRPVARSSRVAAIS